MKISMEIWKSDNNREERHYFLRDGLRYGYQNGAYLWGYNPELVSRETVARINALIEESEPPMPSTIGKGLDDAITDELEHGPGPIMKGRK